MLRPALLLLACALAGSPAWAQAELSPTVPSVPPPLPAQSYGTPFLGVQLPLPAPGAPLAPPVPPPPSQSHLPAQFPAPELTATKTAFELRPSVAFSEQYSDNFFISNTNKTDDFRTTISPGLLVGINGPRTRGTVSATLAVAQDSINNLGDFSFFPTMSAAIKHAFDPRLSVSLVDSFTRNDEPALANPFGLQQQRRTFNSNTLGLSADWLLDVLATQAYYQLSTFSGGTNTISNILGADGTVPFGALTAARAGYEFSHTQTSGASGTESTGHMIWASVARQLGSLTSVGASGSYVLQSLDSTRIGNMWLFTTYELPGRLSLAGSLGYSLLRSDSGGTFSTIATDTRVSYRFARAVVSVALFQGFNQTGLQGENFGVVLTRSYSGSLGYALTPFIDATIRASYSDNEFTGSGNSQSSPPTKTLSAQAGLVWRLQPWLTMRADYTYTQYNSGSPSGGAATVGRAAIVNQATITLIGSF